MVIMSQQYFLYSLAIFIPMNATSIPAPTIHPPQTSILISQYIIPAMTGLDIPSLICAMFFPVSTTDYVFDQETYELRGEMTKKVYKLGDKVRIRVADADKMLKTVDFELVSNVWDDEQ